MTSTAYVPGTAMPLSSLPNLRDLGGWPTADGGRVRRGVLYRSTELGHLSDADLSAVQALGLRTVVDLRTAAERDASPDRPVPRANEVVLDVLADSADAAPAQLLPLLNDPTAAKKALGGGRAVALFEGGYREFVSLPSGLASYRSFFGLLAQAEQLPLLFHCTTGKDRTGWAAAATLSLLGVSEEDVRKDYLLTNQQLVPALQPVFDQFAAAGGDPALLLPILGVQTEYLDAAFDEMRSEFSSIEGYFADGLGIDEAGQQHLRSSLVERD